MKRTRQKEIILETVQNLMNHPTAEDVYQEIKNQGFDIGIATVYRNLNLFAKEGMIKKVTIPNQSDRFDYRLDSHDHFVCEKCGKIIDTKGKVAVQIEDDEVEFNTYNLTLYGVCKDCREKEVA